MTDRRSLAQLLAIRATLDPGEVVTLLAPLADELAAVHQVGRVFGSIDAAGVVLDPGGRAQFATVAFQSADLEALDDVRALAALGWQALTGRPADRPGPAPVETPAALVDALLAALFDDDVRCPDAAAFGESVLRSCPATPIRHSATSHAKSAPTTTPPRRRPRQIIATSIRPPFSLVAAGAAALALAVVVGAAWGRHGGEAAAPVGPVAAPTVQVTTQPSPSTPAPRERPAVVNWKSTVMAIEAARAAAYRRGDLHRLHALYAPGSVIGGRDEAMLRQFGSGRLRVRNLHARVFSVRLLDSSATSARCRVVDAMSSYVLVDQTGAVVRRGAATRQAVETMRLVRRGGRWRIVDVRPVR